MAIQSVQFKLNGQTYNLSFDSSAGVYKATVTAPSTTSYNENSDHKFHGEVTVKDNAGNTTVATVQDFATLGLRVLEKVKPTIAVTYPTNSALVSNNKPTIQWTVEDLGSGIDPDTISIKIDNGATITTGITKTKTDRGYSCEYIPTSVLDDGSHTITFGVSDHDGNAANAVNSSFTVDTVPPTLNVEAPVDGYITNNPKLTVSGTSNDTVSNPVSVTVNGKAVTVASNGSFSTIVQLEEGENTITVIATDAAGKSTTVTRKVTLDTTAPVIQSVTLTPNPVDAGATYIITVAVSE